MTTPSTIRADRRAGEAVEQAVGAWAIARGWTAHRTCGEVGGYDLLLQCTLEVKLDRLASTTGNVAIEVEFRGRPSGIEGTAAAWWCIVVGDVGYIGRTRELRALAATCTETMGGDGRLARLRLVPVVELKRIAREITLPGIEGASDVPSTAPGAAVEPEQRHNGNGRAPVHRQTTMFDGRG